MPPGATDNATLYLLATLGISSLCLFARLEIDVPGLSTLQPALTRTFGLDASNVASTRANAPPTASTARTAL